MNSIHDSTVSNVDLHIRPRAVTGVLTVAAVLIHLANAYAVWLRYIAFDESKFSSIYIRLLSVSGEGKIPTWYSSCTLLLSAGLMWVIGKASSQSRDGRAKYWFGLSLIFLVMSLDEVAELHNGLSRPFRELLNISAGPLASAWIIPGTLFVMVLAIVYGRFFFSLPTAFRFWFGGAAVIYLLGVIGMESIGSAYRSNFETDLTYGILASLEEVLEMGGILVLIHGLMLYLQRPDQRFMIRFDN